MPLRLSVPCSRRGGTPWQAGGRLLAPPRRLHHGRGEACAAPPRALATSNASSWRNVWTADANTGSPQTRQARECEQTAIWRRARCARRKRRRMTNLRLAAPARQLALRPMTDCAVARRAVERNGFCARTRGAKKPQPSAPWFSLTDLSKAKDQKPAFPNEEPHTPHVRSQPSLCFTGDTSDMFLDIVLPGKPPNSRSPSSPDAQAASSSAADSALPDVKMPLMDEIAVAAAAVGGSYPRISAVLHRFNILTRESEALAPCSPPSLVKGPPVGPFVAIRSTVLSDPVLARLASAMPKRFASTDWHLLYSTRSHGLSLGTLYQRVHERGAVACVPS